MIEYSNIFLNNLLPIFLAASAGYFLAKWLPINPKTLSSVAFYIFSPCLVFTLLTKTQLNQNGITQIILIATTSIGVTGLITWAIGRGLRLDRTTLSAVLITSMFMNAGNYGLPLTSFAFGETALAYASLFFVTSAVLSNTAGVVIASSGSMSIKKSFSNLVKLPTLYALVLAIVVLLTGWNVPLPIERTTKILGDASIPTLMILLGVQFHSIRLKGKIIPLTLTSIMRLIISPAIVLLVTVVFGLHGPVRQAAIIESAMPSAVLNAVLATQYDTEPSFVAAAIVVTTILSIFTLTPLLAYLGA